MGVLAEVLLTKEVAYGPFPSNQESAGCILQDCQNNQASCRAGKRKKSQYLVSQSPVEGSDKICWQVAARNMMKRIGYHVLPRQRSFALKRNAWPPATKNVVGSEQGRRDELDLSANTTRRPRILSQCREQAKALQAGKERMSEMTSS